MIKDLVLKNRSYRRFFQEEKIELKTLKELTFLAANCASAANKQPLKYLLSTNTEDNELIFKNLAWAGALKDWAGPEEGEKPAAYILILGDSNISNFLDIDAAIAAQTILLGATEKKLGGCMFSNIKRKKLQQELNISDEYKIVLAIALGKPKEKVVIERIDEGESTVYWRDDDQVHHVPKRKPEDLIIN